MTYKMTPGPTINTKRTVGLNGHSVFSASCFRDSLCTWRTRQGMDYSIGTEANHLAAAYDFLEKRGLDWSIVASGWTKEGMVFVCG